MLSIGPTLWLRFHCPPLPAAGSNQIDGISPAICASSPATRLRYLEKFLDFVRHSTTRGRISSRLLDNSVPSLATPIFRSPVHDQLLLRTPQSPTTNLVVPPKPTNTAVAMDDYVSETDSEYTSYWRDWVSKPRSPRSSPPRCPCTGANLAPSGAPAVPFLPWQRILLRN